MTAQQRTRMAHAVPEPQRTLPSTAAPTFTTPSLLEPQLPAETFQTQDIAALQIQLQQQMTSLLQEYYQRGANLSPQEQYQILEQIQKQQLLIQQLSTLASPNPIVPGQQIGANVHPTLVPSLPGGTFTQPLMGNAQLSPSAIPSTHQFPPANAPPSFPQPLGVINPYQIGETPALPSRQPPSQSQDLQRTGSGYKNPWSPEALKR